jgi:streptogramin lyase
MRSPGPAPYPQALRNYRCVPIVLPMMRRTVLASATAPKTSGGYPRYFAPGADGSEWFLAAENEAPTPILGEVSRLGTIDAEDLAVNPKSDIRGLAIGAEGDLWTTATRLQDTRASDRSSRSYPPEP